MKLVVMQVIYPVITCFYNVLNSSCVLYYYLKFFFFFKQGREKGEGGAEEESENLKQAHAQPDA